MKRLQRIMYLLFFSLFTTTACSINTISENAALGTLAAESEMVITSSDIQVSDFLTKNSNFRTSYDTDKCYNITPDFIADNSDFMIFKYSVSTESFIMYQGEVYSIGTCFGGSGITSMALADLNKDDQYELYYTFSWGSGLHRSQIGYFDPANKEVTIFDYSLLYSDMMLTTNESGELCVNSATLTVDSFVDFSIKAQELTGTIELEENSITLNII